MPFEIALSQGTQNSRSKYRNWHSYWYVYIQRSCYRLSKVEAKERKKNRDRGGGEKETRQERMAIWRRRCVRIGARSFDDEERERESWQGDIGRKRDRLCARHGAAWKEVRDTDVTLDLEARRVQAQTYLAAISHHPPCVSVSPSLLPLPFLSSGASTSLFGGLARGCGFRYRGR